MFNFKCDWCAKEYKYKRNLTRHIKERHLNNQVWKCIEKNRKKKFLRRSYVTRHLMSKHQYDPITAQRVVKETNSFLSGSSSYYEDVSSDDNVIDVCVHLDMLDQNEPIEFFDLSLLEESNNIGSVDVTELHQEEHAFRAVSNDDVACSVALGNSGDVTYNAVSSVSDASSDHNVSTYSDVSTESDAPDINSDVTCRDVSSNSGVTHDNSEMSCKENSIEGNCDNISASDVCDIEEEDAPSEKGTVEDNSSINDVSVNANVGAIMPLDDPNIIVIFDDDEIEPSTLIRKYQIYTVTVIKESKYLNETLVGQNFEIEQDYYELVK